MPSAFLSDNAHEKIGICLFVGRQSAVALRVGHGAVHRQVLFLHHQQELVEALMVFGAQLLIHLEGDTVHGVDRVHSDTPLEACPGFLPQKALHFHLLDQIVGAPVQMAEPVDLVAGQMGSCRHEVLIQRVLGKSICEFYRIHGGPDDRMIDHVRRPISPSR